MLTTILGARRQIEQSSGTAIHAPGAVPVTLLTGFLGSGKTTLLNALLTDARMKSTAVVINEFGSVPVDHDLVHPGSERYVVTTAGCLCCTATSDVRTSLFELDELSRRGTLPSFDRVVVETTGLADPAPIVNSLIPGGAPAFGFRDHSVARRFRLANVVACLDAISGKECLDRHLEAWKQLAFADQIVLTKTDLLDPADRLTERDFWRRTLADLNPGARLFLSDDGAFDPVPLIASGSYTPTGKPEDVLGWLALEQAEPHADHTHDANRHGDVEAMHLIHEGTLDPRALDALLTLLVSQGGSGLLRLKGLVALTDDPERPMVVHAVQHRLYRSPRLDHWPSNDRRTRLVLIGSKLPREPIEKLFQAVVEQSRRARRRSRRWPFGRQTD